MEYRNHSREGPGNTLWAWMACIGAIFIIIGLSINAFRTAELRDLKTRLTTLTSMRAEQIKRVTTAQTAVNTRSSEAAHHWSEGLPEKLQLLYASVQDGGRVAALLDSAGVALSKDNRTACRSDLDSAELLLKESQDATTMILGPPSFYDELARKTRDVDTMLKTVASFIESARSYVDGLRNDEWNRQRGVAFQRSYRQLAEADKQLGTAQTTNSTKLEDDYVLFDKPLAYDQADVAMAIAGSARTLADTDKVQSRDADGAIQAASSAIESAETVITNSDYQQESGQSYLDTVAKPALQRARNLFAGIPDESNPDYIAATNAAIEAQNAASHAIWLSTPPTATPPPPTPEPSHSTTTSNWNWNDSSGSGGTIDTTNDSSPWSGLDTNPSTDWNTDPDPIIETDDWSSDDGFGGTDSWSSDDGFGGSDGWSTDDGF